MLIETIKTTEEKITVELQLPAYYKADSYFFFIKDEESILTVSKYGINNWGSSDLKKAVSGEPCTESEFISAYETAKAKIEYQLPQTA